MTRVLLPPSETKRDGGVEGTRLDLAQLALPALDPQRRAALAALARLSRRVGESMRALGLGPTQRGEIDRNRAVATSPTMPAVDRYTGVLYDALDAASLPPEARGWLGEHVLIQSALLGVTGALDPVPAYRLSASSRLPGLALKAHWAAPVTAALGEDAASAGLVLDLRSEAYNALGPVPATSDGWFVRVVTAGPDGEVRALNHWNKHAKGELVRRLALSRPSLRSIDELEAWGRASAVLFTIGADREVRLVV